MGMNRKARETGLESEPLRQIAALIAQSRHLVVFTGAGMSVESGVPPFRGENGLWNKYDPDMLSLSYFRDNPARVWPVLKSLFFEFFEAAQPHPGHMVLSRLETQGILKAIITQNIDNLHYLAGNRSVIEFHGTSRKLICLTCSRRYTAEPDILKQDLPRCGCGGVLKPNFIFFGESIPSQTVLESEQHIRQCDVLLIIGSTGEVYPAAALPEQAADRGSKIIEINPRVSKFTRRLTDLYIPMTAAAALTQIEQLLKTNSVGDL